MPTTETFRHIKEGDPNGWEDLYKAFPYYVSVLTRKDIPYEEAIDIVQSSMVHLLEVVDRLDVNQNTVSYFWNMVVNKGIDYLRHQRFDGGIPIIEDTEGGSVPGVMPIDMKTDVEGEVVTRMEIERGLGKMSSEQKEVVMLSGIGYSLREIGEVLELPLGTVKTRYNLGREHANKRE